MKRILSILVMGLLLLAGGSQSLIADNNNQASTIVEIKDENNFKEVTNAKGLVLVDFYATWCGPCKKMVPIFEKIGTENKGSLKIYKVDVDKNQALAATYKIQAIPTILLFKDGKLVWRQTGALPYDEIKGIIDTQK